jgi:NAD(P)-dependent dehydrogenase (short-subunit alcohol dehydrogenase family)
VHASELFDLSGKTALVTGGGRGIGRHLAIGLAEAGADVAVASRKLANCEEAAAAIAAIGRRGVAIEADIGDPDSVAALADRALSELGGIDILVNNAGVIWGAPTLDYPIEGWDKVFAVNVRGLWLLSQRVARQMVTRGGGSIIHISSISAQRGADEEAEPAIAYSASKGAVDALTRDMAVKLAPHGIRVNAIAPGPFDTAMLDHVRHDEAELSRFLEQVPMRRHGGEDDIKGAVVFFASEAARFVTGQTLAVDGGMIVR